MRKMIKLTLAASTVVLLAACGGGGSVATNPAQGIWVGETVTGFVTVKTSGVILENGETWSVSTVLGRPFIWTNVTTTVNGNNVSQQIKILSPLAETRSVTQTGTFIAKSTLTLTDPITQAPTTFNYQTSYDTAANLTAILGEWGFNGSYSTNPSVQVPTLTPINASVGTNGVFTLTKDGCNIIGILSPSVNGKNVFNLGLTTSGADCLSSRAIMSGVAFIDTSVNPNELKLIAATPSKQDGLFLIGIKATAP